MTVYVVIGSLSINTGQLPDTDTIKVFATPADAMAYGESLLIRRADTYEIIETAVQ